MGPFVRATVLSIIQDKPSLLFKNNAKRKCASIPFFRGAKVYGGESCCPSAQHLDEYTYTSRAASSRGTKKKKRSNHYSETLASGGSLGPCWSSNKELVVRSGKHGNARRVSLSKEECRRRRGTRS